MAKQLKIHRITQEPNGGRVSIGYSYGTTAENYETSEQQWSSYEQLRANVALVEELLGESGMLLLAVSLTWVKPNGDAGNPNAVVGKTTTLDVYAANPLRVQ